MTSYELMGLFTFASARSRKGGSIEKIRLLKMACMVFVFCIATVIASPAQTFTTLVNFDGTNGAGPYYGSLVQGTDGNFYGTTDSGGANGVGTVFKMTAGGTLTTLHNFDGADGANPAAQLIQATNGNFYGTTLGGGANGYGTVFKITSAGKLTTLHSFDGTDGSYPYDGLVQATNGDFYGTTCCGGANNASACTSGCGTVFKITAGGKLTTFYSFCSQTGCTDGQTPYAGLVQATGGNFYGTTRFGGTSGNCTNGCGTVFEITPEGTLTTLHSFDAADGELPLAGLVQATNGDLYGTTPYLYGTVFEITTGGTLTTLYSFCSQPNCTDGENPFAGLVQATDGNFYGTTAAGGTGNACDGYPCGTVFEITAGGTLRTLHSFDATDGELPYGGLVQATNGNFYGTTLGGGANGYGTVFSLGVGLGPFVETNPTSGKVGSKATILGNNLKSATSVSFNGTAATFKASSTHITTTVPAGATTGTVTVTTSSGTLNSNVPFVVLVAPQITSFTPPSGPIGTQVQITGVSLTNTDVVTFHNVVATDFTVDSDTEVTATVPTGATTGKIAIITPGGTATSATSFKVTK